jgi:Eukaryotic initiation factor 4E
MVDTTDTFLNDSWVLYFHDPNNESWDEKSYMQLATMGTVTEVVQVCEAFSAIWSKGMFFVMREHIRPLWEDDHNINGGCFSFKIMRQDVPKAWFDLVATTTGETLIKESEREQNWDKVCGISISPKRNYCILRIWISDKTWGDKSHYTLKLPASSSILFKEHTVP